MTGKQGRAEQMVPESWAERLLYRCSDCWRFLSRHPEVMDSPDEAPYFCMVDTRCRLCQFELEEYDLVVARLLVRSM
ncbi:unnamed protein product [Fusarium equiseti]|uniref:Uncharacterized protein n=1 Tax=Fusarium equiseti TaxID=61235 RepID=A0A8J2NBL7_FUSEQ|nr:unnamed protein product [Fusarium equiseti]